MGGRGVQPVRAAGAAAAADGDGQQCLPGRVLPGEPASHGGQQLR